MKKDHETFLRAIYTLPEIAAYTCLHTQRVRSWFTSRQLFQADYAPIGKGQAVSFFDLIDVLVAGQLRNSGVLMSTIRNAHEFLKKEFGTQHPFCRGEIYTDGRAIFITTANRLGDPVLSEVVSKQHFFSQVMAPYLKRVDYDDKTHLARRWRIASGVVIDPAICFGKPVVLNTGVSTHVLEHAYRANQQDPDLVADLFNVQAADVLNAVDFERGICLGKAA